MTYLSLGFAMVLVLAGLFTIFASVQMTLQRRAISSRFHELMDEENTSRDWLGDLGQWLELIGRRVAGSAVHHDIRTHLVQAGYFSASAPYIFVALRIGFAICAGLTVLFARPEIQLQLFSWGPLAVAGAAILGYRLTSVFLKMRAEKRIKQIRTELPHVLDIVQMLLGTGVSIDQCLRYVSPMIAHTAPATVSALNKYVSDVDSGLPYDAALDRLGERLGADDARDFVGIIKQVLLHGGELTSTLHRFSEDLVQKYLSMCRENVGRKALYLTMVMLVFFMPVLLIVLAGPAVSELTGTLGEVAYTTERNNP